MAYRAQFGTKRRDFLYSRELHFAKINGLGDHPICPHCEQPVKPDQAWDEVHITPRALGGKTTGVGHRLCNQLDNHQFVTPVAAKAREVWKKHVGIKGPGLGPAPMQCGRRSRQTKTMRHGVQPRLTGAQKHAAFMRKRYLFVDDVDGPIEVHT